jgi:tetratricopeptide (TPR) repeat protein
MKQYLIRTYFFVILFSLSLIVSALASSVSNSQSDERNKAIELFHAGRFEEALPIFKKLSDAYPSDYLLKYFTGASMAETGLYSKETEMNLLLAGTRDVPAKVFYYLARYYHSREDWDSALRFYNRFINNSQPAEVKELRIDDLTELAYDHVNPFLSSGVKIPERQESAAPDTAEDTSDLIVVEPVAEEAEVPAPEPPAVTVPELPVPVVTEPNDSLSGLATGNDSVQTEMLPPATDSSAVAEVSRPAPPAISLPPHAHRTRFIRFQVNPQVTYLTDDMFQVEEAKKAWTSASEKEEELSRLLDTLAELRSRYQQALSTADRELLATRIIAMERQTLIQKAETEQLFQNARYLEQQWWTDAGNEAYERFKHTSDSLLRLEEALRIAALPPPPVIDDLLISEELDLDEEGEADGPGPDDVIFKVQLGSFTRAVPARTQALFDKIGKIRPIDTFVGEDGATVYTTGNMRTFADGLALQNQVRVEGVKDAFVIAIRDGKRVSLPEAKILTGEE